MLSIDLTFYELCVIIVVAYILAGWLIPLGIKINYGRLKGTLFSYQFPPQIAWVLMQIPNLAWIFYFLVIKGDELGLGYFLFALHYINRTIIYPLTLKSKNTIPIQIVVTAASFTFANGYLQSISNQRIQNGQYINYFVRILGVIIFFIGMYINIKSDRILQATKVKKQQNKSSPAPTQSPTEANTKGGSKHNYVVINQFLFKYVSNPNYFGQIIEWMGYFFVCQNLQSFLFFFSTLNILTAAAIPRSQWNKKNIEGYPKNKKAVIPYII